MMIPDRRPLLIVSLPRNDPALAAAARQGGADVLKVHVNVRHLASGTVFGTLAQERPRLEQILAFGLPTGLVPGEERMLAPEEMPEIRRMGFAFLDAFVDTIQPHLYEAGIPVIPALPHSADDRFLERSRDLPGDWVEAAVVAPDGYGKPPEKADFVALRKVGKATRKRLIVPSQRWITPAHAVRYFGIPQVTALMIGAVVTGMEAKSLGAATAAFRRALDRLF
ncbi:MAG: hypothetical protein QN141_02435 [Armatimonadota bacterium]|nr:hypothetical protein [Armatimonadota bacterium]MDR7493848.1 hypothetical protein [Armatimonadota bacterium]MDR7498991.1 hypothetical protein [Armatimonadota bacterium]MDR7504812.1 hypothetical protein [Armatimonadota bacterium]MDR7546130.1 hypothetical protein [Armatimonadota bacterium]